MRNIDHKFCRDSSVTGEKIDLSPSIGIADIAKRHPACTFTELVRFSRTADCELAGT